MYLGNIFSVNRNLKQKIFYIVFSAIQAVPIFYLLSIRTPLNSAVFLFAFAIFLITVNGAFITYGRSPENEQIKLSRLRIFIIIIILISILLSYFFMLSHDESISTLSTNFNDNRFGGFLLGIMFGSHLIQRLINGFVIMQTIGALDWIVRATKHSI
jgi:hypothetical protein